MEEIQEPIFSRKALIRLIIPLIVEQVLAVTIGMADTVMVSSVGEAAVSGISLVDTINILLINIFSALTTGGAVVAAQYLGRREPHSARVAAKQLFYSCTALALLLMTAALIWNEHILRLVFGNIVPEVMENSKIYFAITAVSYPFLAIYNSGAALFRAEGNSKVSMYTSALMNLVNICGNAILIYGFGWGVAGAAVATLVSRILGAAVITGLVVNPHNTIYIEKIWKPEVHLSMIGKIMQIGVPNGLENSLFQVGKILVQSIITTFGTAAIAANAIANSIASFEGIPGAAIGLAMITVVGQCVGAGDYDQAKKYTLRLLKLTYLSISVISVLLLVLVNPLTSAFQLSEEATRMARELIIFHSICCMIIWPPSFTLPNGLRAANDAKFTMLVSVISMWVCRIGLSYVFAYYFHMGLFGVWVAMIADWIVRSIVFIIRFASGKWKNRQLIRDEK